MNFNIGDIVTRKSYNNDIVFEIIGVDNDLYILRGISVRLKADGYAEDLELYNGDIDYGDCFFENKIETLLPGNRNEYFYLPGKILQIDGDANYLKRCLNFYAKANIKVIGVHEEESKMALNIKKHLDTIKPDILIITGHDAYYRSFDKEDEKAYKNTNNFVNTIIKAREYEKDHDRLIIIAGACQSNYEKLIEAGANFGSSPKRINIHALDPAIVALMIALTERSKDIDLIGILEKTKCGKDGIGGLITKGMMYVGYPK